MSFESIPVISPVLRLFLKPIQKVLKRLLPQNARDFIDTPENRHHLVLLADSLLVAEVPQARLVPKLLRQNLIAQVLDQILPTAAEDAATAGLETVKTAAAWAEAAELLPTEEQVRQLGVRGFTLKAAAGVSPQELQAMVENDVEGVAAIKPFPSLPSVYTVELAGEDKPLVSQAYEIAERWVRSGKVTYAEPNLAIPAVQEPAAALESAFGGPGEWDRNHPSTVTNFEWSLDRIFARGLWNHPQGSKGRGVIVGHIDTGYTLHPELKTNLDRAHDYDFWNDDEDAEDPLKKSLFDRLSAFPVLNPGHGTGTGSVIASPAGKQAQTSGAAWVTGTAPEVTLIPLRATPSVVIVPGGSQDEVARAIIGAANRGVDVISMSLGSPWDSAILREAIKYALDKGVIVCAAAGNIVAQIIQGDRVTFPAKYQGVVAVAGCDFDYKPWTRSCRGPEVDITAPGTDVWRAAATKDLDSAIVERGSGTSFAVAMVAGMAACWIGRHGGKQALLNHYGSQARLIPAAFLLALRKHAKTLLVDGDPAQFGGGVLHGKNLAELPLPPLHEVQGALPEFSPQLETPLAALESISPLAAESATIAGSFEAWTGKKVSGLSALQIRAVSARIAGDPRLLAEWWRVVSGVARAGVAGPSLESPMIPMRQSPLLGVLEASTAETLASALTEASEKESAATGGLLSAAPATT
jgi:hypothetical protein